MRKGDDITVRGRSAAGGVWLALDPAALDLHTATVFLDELSALRYANQSDMFVIFWPFGVPVAEVVIQIAKASEDAEFVGDSQDD